MEEVKNILDQLNREVARLNEMLVEVFVMCLTEKLQKESKNVPK